MDSSSRVLKRNLRSPEAAAYVRLSASTMAKMRSRGDGPIYSKAGPRVVIYDQDHLEDWLAGRARRSTSQLDSPLAK